MGDDAPCPRVPLGREKGNAEGEVGGLSFTVDGELKRVRGSGRMTGGTFVKIKFRGSHSVGRKLCRYFAILLQF